MGYKFAAVLIITVLISFFSMPIFTTNLTSGGSYEPKDILDPLLELDSSIISHFLNHSEGVQSVVTIGVGPNYDFNPTGGNKDDVVIKAALNELIRRTNGKGGSIFIGPCTLDNSGGNTIYLYHPSLAANSGVLKIEGCGSSNIVTPKGKVGLVIGKMDKIIIEDLRLVGPDVSNLGICAIDCNATSIGFVCLSRLTISKYDRGINISSPPIFSSLIKDIQMDNCGEGIWLSGNANTIERIVFGYSVPRKYMSNSTGFKIDGIQNTICQFDAGNAYRGGILSGEKNHIVDMWCEDKCIRALEIYGSAHIIQNIVSRGEIKVAANSCYIDPMYSSNYGPSITIDPGSLYNVINRNSYYSDGMNGVGKIDDKGMFTYKTKYTSASSIPDIGIWQKGDVCWNSEVRPGGSPGWVCIEDGQPGRWQAMANLSYSSPDEIKS